MNPHIVVTIKGGRTNLTEFDDEESAHRFAENAALNGECDRVIVARRIRTITPASYLFSDRTN